MVIPGLMVALEIAKQHAEALARGANQISDEIAFAATQRIVRKLEAAIAEARRQGREEAK